MTKSSVPNQINNNIPLECIPKLNRSLESILNLNRTIRINMYNRTICPNTQHSRVQPMSILSWCSSKSNLIITHHMDRAGCGLVVKVGHLHQFVIYALALEGCVAVQDDGHVLQLFRLPAAFYFHVFLRGAGVAFANWVHCVEVGWVGHAYHHHFTFFGFSFVSGPHVVFDIS